MIPGSMKYSMEGASPSFADNEGQIIEARSQVRLRIKGIRSELNQMFAIGSIREDYLGYGLALSEQITPITDRWSLVLFCRTRLFRHCATTTTSCLVALRKQVDHSFFSFIILVTAVYHNLDFSEALETWEREKLRREKTNKGEESYVYVFHVINSRYPIGTRNCSFSLLSHLASSGLPFTSIKTPISDHPSPNMAGKPPNAPQTHHQPP
jgi:hypothetical protein